MTQPPFLPTVGIDVVHIPAFAEQLQQPGSRFIQVFSAREQRLARQKTKSDEHLAGRWAAKEAFIKAWSQALYGRPPIIQQEQVVWRDIEVRPDKWGRVGLELYGTLKTQLATSLGPITTNLSISHDGDYATAVCIISRTE